MWDTLALREGLLLSWDPDVTGRPPCYLEASLTSQFPEPKDGAPESPPSVAVVGQVLAGLGPVRDRGHLAGTWGAALPAVGRLALGSFGAETTALAAPSSV